MTYNMTFKQFIAIAIVAAILAVVFYFMWKAVPGKSFVGQVASAATATTTNCDSIPIGWLFCNDHIRFNMPLKMGSMIDMQGNSLVNMGLEIWKAPNGNCFVESMTDEGTKQIVPANCYTLVAN
jgi:hypothetical protein